MRHTTWKDPDGPGGLVRCCINCEGFAWWDGDYCCTLHMRIHQHAPGTDPWFREDILKTMKGPVDCKDYRADDDSLYTDAFCRFLELRRLEWEYHRQAAGQSLIKKEEG